MFSIEKTENEAIVSGYEMRGNGDINNIITFGVFIE
jgi:hypothetical protein